MIGSSDVVIKSGWILPNRLGSLSFPGKQNQVDHNLWDVQS